MPKPTTRPISHLLTKDGEKFTVRETRHPSASYGQRFTTMFDAPLSSLADRIHSATALRVFLKLPALLDFETWRPLRQAALADELGTRQSAISRALAELARAGVLDRQGTGPLTTWRLSMQWGWRGNVAAYQKAKRNAAKIAKRLGDDVTAGPPIAGLYLMRLAGPG